MNCRRDILLICLAAAWLAAWPAGAQDGIIFSKPPDDPAGKANALVQPTAHGDRGAFNAPAPLFNGGKPQADFDLLPSAPAPRILSPAEIKQLQKNADEKNNWGLLTPAEIMDVPTPEKIFGLPEPEGEKNLSLEERYVKRLQQRRELSATNAMRSAGSFWGDAENPFQAAASDRKKTGADALSERSLQNYPGQLLNPQGPAADAAGNSDSPWRSAFTGIPAVPKPDPEQVAEMDRFRAMMDSGPPPETPPSVQVFSRPPAPAADPFLQAQPVFNPAGNSFKPVESSVGKPTGITPLPGIVAPPPKPPPAQPLAKPPPWLSDQPAPNTPPRWNNF